MARTQSISVPDELKNLEAKALQRRDRFVLGVVQGQRSLPSKKQKRLLGRLPEINSPMVGRGSLFRYFAPAWKALTTTEKNVWKTAATYSGISGWQLYVSDNSARIKNYLTEGVPPSNLWQVNGGRILIESPASEILLQQDHPLDYWVTQKIRGRSYKQELVLLRESFSFPLSLAIRYKSNLSAVGGTQIARFFARIKTSYQGIDRYNDVVLNFSASSDWALLETSFSGVRGIFISYTLFIEIFGYTGELLFDNIRAVHSGTNWARDPRCDDISKVFTKAFSIVPPFWVPVTLPSGASYSSVFPPAL